MTDTIVLGRDEIGVVAESDGLKFYLTECCGASAKGLENYVGCRSCYQEIDPILGSVPDKELVHEGGKISFVPREGWHLIEVYGDGLPYDVWKARARQVALEEHVAVLRGGS